MATLPMLTPQQSAENKGPHVIIGCLTVAVLATIAVVLRFSARRLQKSTIGADDYLILLALPFAWATCAAILVAVSHGLGKHANTLTLQQRIVEGQAYFSAEPIWALAIGLIKMSILLLYVQIFRPLRYMRHLAYGIGVFTMCWSIMAILVFCLQCRPVQRIWDKAVPGTCINAWLFFVISSAINVVTDFVVLVLPMRATWGLQLPIPQRISVMGIFMLGSLTSIIGLVRLVMIINNARALDSTWATTMVGVWSVAEPCLGIVAACLPTMGPFVAKTLLQLAKLRNGLDYSWSMKRTTDNSPTWAAISIDRAYNDLQPLQDSDADARMDTYITSVERPKASGLGQAPSIPLNAIEVNTTTSWTDQ